MGKDIEELAKLGQKGLETSEKAGGWLDSVFGGGARQLGGAWTDSMAGFRARNRLRVLAKTQKAIDDAGMSGSTRPLGDRMTLPLLEAIEQESDDTLQNVWSAYIKNSVDPERPNPDRILIEVIRRLEPSDWSLLKMLFQVTPGSYKAADLNTLSETDLETAMDRFVSVRLFDYDDPRSGYLVMGGHLKDAVKVTIGDATYYEAKLLRSLQRATEGAW